MQRDHREGNKTNKDNLKKNQEKINRKKATTQKDEKIDEAKHRKYIETEQKRHESARKNIETTPTCNEITDSRQDNT